MVFGIKNKYVLKGKIKGANRNGGKREHDL